MSAASGRETEKAQGYINALDNARSEDKWSEVPELIRKVTKHAPHRKCLIQTATAEVQVVAHVSRTRPGTAKGQAAPNQVSNLSELIPTLLAAIEEAEGTPEDVFHAQICLGWIHWTLSEPGLAVTRLPNDFEEATITALADGKNGITKWTEICIVKAGYIKSAAQSAVSGTEDALKTASSILPRLSTPNPALASSPQAMYWSEKFLSKVALVASEVVDPSERDDNEFEIALALKAFRLWSGHPHVKQRDILSGNQPAASSESGSPFNVWMSYFGLLSTILQNGMEYFPPSKGAPRSQLVEELCRVETVCEKALLREFRFPTAEGSNPRVEVWVEEVIHNWQVLCGPGWRDSDLGEGGQDAISRNVLEILYRAATKTYHSHLIMRRLFHVHASLAEFELAIKALDTYVEIVVSAKDRAEKAAETGELESNETLLQTVSEGVLLLCSFGAENEARKAKELITILEKYIEKSTDPELGKDDETTSVSPKVFALAYRAIGIGLGNWSRWTSVNESRDDIRAEAIENLEKSIDPAYRAPNNISTRYALALLYAESRDLDSAILHVRTALSTKDDWAESTHVSSDLDGTTFSREQDLVPLWHLLALLLSAKHEFGGAGRSCEAAFDQFPSNLTTFVRGGGRVHREKDTRASADTKKEFMRHLRGREKERIIETRMTQIALIEVVDGPETAVNHSDHLLTLFAALFEELKFEVPPQKANGNQRQLGPPKSAAGTVKSFRGSIFGRKKGSKNQNTNGTDDIPPLPTRIIADADAPSIQITDGKDEQHPKEAPKQNGVDAAEQIEGPENGSIEKIGIALSDVPDHPAGTKHNAKQPLPPVAHNLDHAREPQPAGHSRQPPEQDVRLPLPYRYDSPTKSLTKFPTAQAQKHALALLVKVWLLIAGLYRRASLFEDAQEACQEALKQVEKFEALVAAQDPSARGFSERAWGVYKSCEELWGDVFAERGALSQAQNSPHEAVAFYEEAITRFPDHPKATIGLSGLLLDIWDEKIPAEPLPNRLDAGLGTRSPSKPSSNLNVKDQRTSTNGLVVNTNKETKTTLRTAEKQTANGTKADQVRYMNRLAARDRAYGLLSMLTKTGSSWDNSEAWFTLSRAYEASSQFEKARDVLWWCVELEDRKPVRHWWNLGSGSYVL